MQPGPFIFAAYAVTILGTGAMLIACWLGMRSAERRLEERSGEGEGRR